MLFQFVASLHNGHAGDVCGRGSVRAGVVRRNVGISTENCNIVHIAVHQFGYHLGKNRITAGTHISSTNNQVISAVFAELQSCGTNVNIGDAAALHAHGNASGSDFAVAHIANLGAFFPVKHLTAMLHTTVQSTGIGNLVVVGGHDHAFLDHVDITDFRSIHTQLFGQFTDDGFYSEDTLGSTVTAVSARCLMVRINYIIVETMGFQGTGVQGQCLVTGKTNGGRTMFAVGAGIGQGIQIHNADLTIVHSTHSQRDFHLMTGRTGNLGLLTGVGSHGRPTGLHSNKGRIYITDRRLLCTETTADTRLFHADLTLGNTQCPG